MWMPLVSQNEGWVGNKDVGLWTSRVGNGAPLRTMAQELLLPVKAIVLNLYSSDLPKVAKSEVSKQCERDCDC